MSARKLFYHKKTRGDVIVEMVAWQLPENRPKGHINLNKGNNQGYLECR
jgi:hypothetical protein